MRGRPRGRSNRYYTNLESMALIADKYDLDPKRLVDAFFEALENEISHCGSLQISCRKVIQDSAIFLITKNDKVVWQFPLNLESIRNPGARDDITKISMPKNTKKKNYGQNQTIADLRLGMKGITVKAKMIEIPPARLVMTRWGSSACVSNVTIADDTGTIRLGLWNGQIETVHIGDEVELTNCRVARFRGVSQLRLQRKSTISVINQIQNAS